MRSILRAGLGALLGVALVFSTAYALEYDDVFELTDKGVSVTTLVQLVVDDGRAFDLSDEELSDLRAAGVDEIVIEAMLDPAVGRAWLAGDRDESGSDYGYAPGGTAGYSSSLDEAYGQGYDDGRKTALVYSFGYYYGPLARYYYSDPFYYPFWSAGYGYSSWPSYYASWYRPAYDWYSPYPYNWYTYSSYYCYTYYDPGYWASRGYTVQPGYGRTVWDDGPRWRDGGIAPPKGGRPDGSVVAPSNQRLLDGQLVAGRGRNLRGPSAPSEIKGAIVGRTPVARRAPATTSTVRTPGTRVPETRVGAGIGRRGAVERSAVGRSSTTVRRGGMRDVSSGSVRRSSGRDGAAQVPSVERRVGRSEAIRRSYSRPSGGTERVVRPARGSDEGWRPRQLVETPEAPAPSRGEERRGEVRRDPPPPPAREPARGEDTDQGDEKSARGVIKGVRGGR